MTNDLVTKIYLDQRLGELKNELKNEIHNEIDGLEERTIKRSAKSENKIMNKLDQIAGTLSKADEENAAGALANRRMSDQLNDHEQRLAVLEKSN